MAASLGIADLLENGSRSSDEPATSTECDPDALLRLLRALASVGVLNELPDKRFELTAAGDCLRATAPASHKAWSCYVGGLVKSVLMDEPDGQAAAILDACKRAMRQTGKLRLSNVLSCRPMKVAKAISAT